MSKFRIYLGYAIGCIGCLIGGMTAGHLAALYHHDANSDETAISMACKDDNLYKVSYLKYAKKCFERGDRLLQSRGLLKQREALAFSWGLYFS